MNTKFTKETAAEFGKRGGKQTSDRKKIISRINARRKCSSKCPFFDSCPLMPISFGSKDKKCRLKDLPTHVKTKYYNLFLAGEEGLLQEIKQIVWKLIIYSEKEDNFKELERVSRILMDFYKLIYGEKRNIQHSGKVHLEIIVEEVDVDDEPNAGRR